MGNDISQIQEVLNAEDESTPFVDKSGTLWISPAGEIHRVGGPAIVWAEGRREWFSRGKRHREDGPAIEHPDGSKEWYQNDDLHRINGPAVEHCDGEKQYWIRGRKTNRLALLAFQLSYKLKAKDIT